MWHMDKLNECFWVTSSFFIEIVSKRVAIAPRDVSLKENKKLVVCRVLLSTRPLLDLAMKE